MQRPTPFYSPAQVGGFVYCIIARHSFCHSEHMQFKVKTAGRTYSPPRLIQLNYLNLFTVSFFIGFDTFFYYCDRFGSVADFLYGCGFML